MYISVNTIANAINNKQHLKTGDIIKCITVEIIDNSRIYYQVIDSTSNIEYYSENTVPVSVVKLMNYHRPVKTWKRDNKEFFKYVF